MDDDDGTDAGEPAPRRPVVVRSGSVVGFVAVVTIIGLAVAILLAIVVPIVAGAVSGWLGLGPAGKAVLAGLLLLACLLPLLRLFVSFARNLHSATEMGCSDDGSMTSERDPDAAPPAPRAPQRSRIGQYVGFVACGVLVLICAGGPLVMLATGLVLTDRGSVLHPLDWWHDAEWPARVAAAVLAIGGLVVLRLLVSIALAMLRGHEMPEVAHGGLLGRVSDLMRDVAEHELLPRFRTLKEHEIREKSPGEVVTEADVAAEAALEAGLRKLFLGAFIVGEEAAAKDPSLLDDLGRHEIAFLIDPLDGTSHFAAGEEPFGIMVTLLRHGRVDAGWIHMAHSGHTLFARRGEGAYLDGERVALPTPPPMAHARGSVLSRFLPPDLKPTAVAARAELGPGEPHRCAAQRTLDIVRGVEHFALYYRTLPWDHAACSLIIEEAGGVVRRYDGTRYIAANVDEVGLLIAGSPALWTELQARLVPSIRLVERPA